MADLRDDLWLLAEGDEPVIATAIHDGHELRPEVQKSHKLNEADRLREEDPYTGRIASVADTHIVPRRSRFEVDLNRPRDGSVYLNPADAWGLDLWEEPPTPDLVERSLSYHDAFYGETDRIFERMARDFGAFVVFDVHSYNHRRLGPDIQPEDSVENPQVNIGTETMDRDRWAPIVERFIEELAAFELNDKRLDVRENVKFFGRGNLTRRTHSRYGDAGCVLAIEFRKCFMDEWTGEVYEEQLAFLREALGSTIPTMIEEVTKIGTKNRRGAR